MSDDEWDFPPATPNQWVCAACGHQFTSPWPSDRSAFYAKPRARKCPKCETPEAAMPHGF